MKKGERKSSENKIPVQLIRNATVFSPRKLGKRDVLLIGEKIFAMEPELSLSAIRDLGCECEVLDARGEWLVPGLIDPHQHLLGGSGEEGFSSQSFEISLSELVKAGITSVVGCLGVDTTMKTMEGLLAKVKAFDEQSFSAFVWTGGYSVPPDTLLKSVRHDILFVQEVIGAGEIAIADERATEPDDRELAKLVTDVHVGGSLSKKAGVTHFHVGEGDNGLAILFRLLENFVVKAEWLYPTHVQRTEKLLKQAVKLAKLGATVDMDLQEDDLAEVLEKYRKGKGPEDKLTFSSDAGSKSPQLLFSRIQKCVREDGYAIEEILPFFTENTARILKLGHKGKIAVGCDADLLVIEPSEMRILESFSRGRRLIREGEFQAKDKFLETSNRRYEVTGRDELEAA